MIGAAASTAARCGALLSRRGNGGRSGAGSAGGVQADARSPESFEDGSGTMAVPRSCAAGNREPDEDGAVNADDPRADTGATNVPPDAAGNPDAMMAGSRAGAGGAPSAAPSTIAVTSTSGSASQRLRRSTTTSGVATSPAPAMASSSDV